MLFDLDSIVVKHVQLAYIVLNVQTIHTL